MVGMTTDSTTCAVDARRAVEALIDHYDRSVAIALKALESEDYAAYAQVTYPKLSVEVTAWTQIDRTEPFAYVDEPGIYSAVLSKPRLMQDYLVDQLTRLCRNYPCQVSVVDSGVRIAPEYVDGAIPPTNTQRAAHPDTAGNVPRPTLDEVDDGIVDGNWDAFHQVEKPLFYFTAQRFDIACARITHYTGLAVETLQKFVLFTNYSMHTREFLRFGLAELAREDSRYSALVLPDGRVLNKDSDLDGLEESGVHVQMPRYDLVAPGGHGITIINIGVGPSNAKTITDCIAVLRPEAWVMIGHCAGMDARMRIGDLILGNAYQRADYLLDQHVPLTMPIPAIPEVQRALEASVKEIYGADLELMRTGTVLSTGDRNWEWQTNQGMWAMLRGSTAAACDMESATLAANGYRYRVPYGTLLSVSDLPLHAVPKLPAGAQAFYSSSKEAHLMCAVRAMEYLAQSPERLRTRKLRRTIAEVPFR